MSSKEHSIVKNSAYFSIKEHSIVKNSAYFSIKEHSISSTMHGYTYLYKYAFSLDDMIIQNSSE
ncbi:hypothetical protein MAR_034489, partial [Mya arenaria]